MNNIVNILKSDYDDLTKGEKQIIRNKARELYSFTGKIEENLLFMAYLMMKRKFVLQLEQILISPKEIVQANGPFNDKRVNIDKVPIPVFDGLNASQKGFFYITEPTFLPLLTVSYFETVTDVICLSPEGSFCKITTQNFSFEI